MDDCMVEQRYYKELASTLRVQIHSYEKRIPKGTIMFMLDKTMFPFVGFDQMCLFAEEYLIRKKLFVETASTRSLVISDKVYNSRSWQEYLECLSKQSPHGYTQTFVIHFLAQGNQSLQGELRVENQKCCFRSGMELARLMHQWLQLKYETNKISSKTFRGEDKGEKRK